MKTDENHQNISIVYIAGYGRSGSTLLDTILGNHPKIFGGGELTNLFGELIDNNKCSCQKNYYECDFWTQVLHNNKQFSSKENQKKAKQTTLQMESLTNFNQNITDYCDLWRELLKSISEISGKKIIVDSSKTNRKTWNRIFLFGKCGFNLKIIHLVRDPRAVMWSVIRGCNKRMEAGARSTKYPGGMTRGILGWIVSNMSVEFMKYAFPSLDILLVKYEDFVVDPQNELKKIGLFLNVNMECLCKYIEFDLPFESGHGVSGNRMRRKTIIRLKKDAEWIDHLPKYLKTLALISYPLMKKYGY